MVSVYLLIIIDVADKHVWLLMCLCVYIVLDFWWGWWHSWSCTPMISVKQEQFLIPETVILATDYTLVCQWLFRNYAHTVVFIILVYWYDGTSLFTLVVDVDNKSDIILQKCRQINSHHSGFAFWWCKNHLCCNYRC